MLIIIMGVLTCLIFFIGVENLFVKNIKYKLIYRLVRYINNKKINNIVMLISKNKIDANKEDIRNIVIANYLEKGHIYDSIAITIFLSVLGYILGGGLDIMIDEDKSFIVVEYIILIILLILVVIREQLDYIVEQKTLLDLKKKKDKS
ncbi:hypothetical protein [Megamonas funiformis]|jgi:hypothetical protein|uniref:hypothetical protein n=1 Tax=Megamonas funiformis TaxID=437897 RepID=UPI0026DF39F0|nr:hypothetical protein [Megamonas funiformis]